MRKLASIQKITKLSPIDGADKIEVASILGWKVVVQKGLHVEGDLVVYFEIDSVLPELPEFEFLRKSCYVTDKTSVNGSGFRLKTIKLRGQISQGLIIPMRELTGYLTSSGDIGDNRASDISYYEEGDDVTDLLGVVKFERPIPANLAGKIRGNFPSFIPKTDQERIQNFIKDYCEKYRDHEWEVSLKLDGSSMTVYYNAEEDRFGVCSRNLDLTETEDNSFWQVARKHKLEELMRDYSMNGYEWFGKPISFAIQGELMGPGVQGNREKLTELDFYVYDVWDITNQKYLDSKTRIDLCEYFGIQHVPVYEVVKLGYDTADGFLELAEFGYEDGLSINNKVREGLVFKSVNDPSISFKAISQKYLLKDGE